MLSFMTKTTAVKKWVTLHQGLFCTGILRAVAKLGVAIENQVEAGKGLWGSGD